MRCHRCGIDMPNGFITHFDFKLGIPLYPFCQNCIDKYAEDKKK